MPKALTPQQRADREAEKKAHRARQVQSRWLELMQQASEHRQRAVHAFELADMKPRELWLILGLFEVEEQAVGRGANESAKTVWFDRIAPRVDGGYGVSGFGSRVAARLTEFIRSSHNGYLYLTELGYALVLGLRDLHPDVLNPEHSPYGALALSASFEVPAPRWRAWLP